jgi:hypothetical protein
MNMLFIVGIVVVVIIIAGLGAIASSMDEKDKNNKL